MSIITSKIQQLDANGNVVDQSALQGFESAFKDENMSGVSYYGLVNEIGNWIIRRESATDSDFAKGLTDLATNWASRASLTYAKYDVVF